MLKFYETSDLDSKGKRASFNKLLTKKAEMIKKGNI